MAGCGTDAAARPLVWGPLSEVYGRRNPLMCGMFGFIILQIPVAVATDLQTLFVCRFFAGAFGSAPLGIVAGMYVDFYEPVERSMATMVSHVRPPYGMSRTDIDARAMRRPCSQDPLLGRS